MDPTWQAALAALTGAVTAGGAVLAWHVSDRQQHTLPPAPEPTLSPEVATLLSVLRSSAVVVDDSDTVVKASAPALALGLVRDGVLAGELAEVVHKVRRDGEIRETELRLFRDGMPVRTVTARVAPLGSRLVLALVEDRTKERRLEAVRRDFVANVSHELKTPVGAIQLLAEAVDDAADDPEAVQRFAGRMQAESRRLTTLVQQIIELSRVQDDDTLDTPELVNIDEVVQAAIDTSTTDASAKQIRLVASGQTGLQVRGSRDQIVAAVSNLVTNAVAYSDGGSQVVLNTHATPDTVDIAVVDQGIGIPPEEVERIFERFYRVDPARHRSTGGTGLGLSIVKHVAATHGGDVGVWSVPGHGSTFTLTLPRSGATDAVASPEPGPAGPALTQEARE